MATKKEPEEKQKRNQTEEKAHTESTSSQAAGDDVQAVVRFVHSK